MNTRRVTVPKYEQIYRALRGDIERGRWRVGERLPSEAELIEQFGVSRITVGRAMRELQGAGLVDRRPGSGTYVREASAGRGLSFGLLIPDLGETEIFEPIFHGMMSSARARGHALLWGSPSGSGETRDEDAWQLCRQFVERRVSGVFFAPLELLREKEAMNLRISRELESSGLAVVLLDRTVTAYPERGPHDLVGIDNRRAGFLMTDHLIRAGARRVGFVGVVNAAATVDEREAGYREALERARLEAEGPLAGRFDPTLEEQVKRYMAIASPDAILAANDRTAAHLMHALLRLGYAIPGDVRLAGIDDVDYASLLPVGLTTYRQPTNAIGAAALATMLERIEHPDSAIRDVLLHGDLIVRESCGMGGSSGPGG